MSETVNTGKENYRKLVQQLGKKQFTFLKMQEYGFWPKDLPTPYEQQEDESDEAFAKRQQKMKNYDILITKITKLYKDRGKISIKLLELKQKVSDTHNIEKVRKEIGKQIWEESLKRRAERKKQKELEKKRRSEAWKEKKKNNIVFVGENYSSMLYKLDMDEKKLKEHNLEILKDAKDLAKFLELEFKELRFLTYHRDVVSIDHYIRYEIPKRSGGIRKIAAPKLILKKSQRAILDKILSNIKVSENTHGFLAGKSVISNANSHPKQPYLILNMDLTDFFPTITFERVRGMFIYLGYSGHISTLLAILCTYCERIPIKVKNKVKYVATSKRILPQGSPASPMITNIICRRLDKRLEGLSKEFGFTYSRYADDLSFSLQDKKDENLGRFYGLVHKIIKEEGFKINPSKTRFLRKNYQQKITGIILNNQELGLPRKWIKNYRAALYNANNELEKNGKIPDEKKHEISGMTSWVKSVNPERYEKLLKTANKIIK
ncbi:MAG: reverse transcriptase domain-containing protein [Promethearchaeota archaeon]